MASWRHVLVCGLALAASPAAGQDITTYGDCSQAIYQNSGTVNIRCDSDGSEMFDVELVRARLACNALEERKEIEAGTPSHPLTINHAPFVFSRLKAHDRDFVFLDLRVWVGYGCGLDEISEWGTPKWGFVYDVGDYLDGFPGDHAAYTYGYRLELGSAEPEYAAFSDGWASVLLFPDLKQRGYFEVKYGKSISLYGLARISVTHVQGTDFIEILPVEPYSGLAVHYANISKLIKDTFGE